MKRSSSAAVVTAAFAITLSLQAHATSQPIAGLQPPMPADFGQWERLVPAADRGGLSPDGKWLAYGIARTNRDNELRLVNVANGALTVVPFGTGAVFSPDSQWLAASVGVHESQEEKLRKEKKPIHRKLALIKLSTREQTTIDGIESFAFNANGTHLMMRRYAPERQDKKDGDAGPSYDPDDTPGVTTIVRELATGRDTTFGNVSEAVWQTKGSLLGVTIAAEDRTGNGVQIFDPASGAVRPLDSGPARYLGLAWRKDAADIAVLKSQAGEHRDGARYSVLAWTNAGGSGEKRHQYDPSADSTLAAGQRTVAFRRPVWSDDGQTIFVGIAPWLETRPQAKNDTGEDDDVASVDVWHARDVDVMPKQKVNAKRDRERSLLAAWRLDSARLVALGHDFDETVTPLKAPGLAYVISWSSHPLERSWGRFGSATLSMIDTGTGARSVIVDGIDDRFVHASPEGKYVLYYQGGQFFTVDTSRRTLTNITKDVATSFGDSESDSTDVQKPWFGYAGWTSNDRDVLLYDKFDVWQVAPDGSKATRLTDGAAEQTRYRYVDLASDEEPIDASKPIYLSMFGMWSKKSGYARIAPGATAERLVWLEQSVDRLGKAKNAAVYAYVAQTFADSPDVFVAGGDLKNARQVTATNPFQSKYAWGRAELVEYTSERGARLQGALRYPAGYEPGRTYPMVVVVYEKRSDSLHQYSAPSEREYYNISSFTSAGYFVLEPDIVFRARDPGLSVIECIRPAVAAVAHMGVIDPKKVGVIGHSWGGFDTAFLATHTDVFAAAVAGAPITDLVSNYGNHHWGPGIAETDHIETGQQRMQVPLWEDLAAYTRNSAVFGLQDMTTPLLIEVGDADGTVFWHQGVELYNVARRAKKDVVLLVYAKEDHGLRQKANQLDYHRRIMEWFGHYLKGETAASWITNGVTYLDKERSTRIKATTGS
jgi:dipeptidyl aminopeptidase/acylaminoacyl peptidase